MNAADELEMKVTIIIPARFKSTRFPGKPLVELNCFGGVKKSLINLTWEAARKVRGVDDIYVATDDLKISEVVKEFGGKVILTSKNCVNGTERCAEAFEKHSIESDLVVNFQGDAPLTPPSFIEHLIEDMKKKSNTDMATPVLRLDKTAYKNFRLDRKKGLIGGTTVTFDSKGYALYFSKEVIPYLEIEKLSASYLIPAFHHVGVYAYKPKVLKEYVKWKEGKLEKLEGLEQLRFLENGKKIKCVEVDGKGQFFWELNNPEDVERIEKVLKEKSI